MQHKIKVFETFAGIGAQHKALNILKNNVKNFDFEIVGTSEWDIRTNISYNLIHNSDKLGSTKDSEREEWEKKHSLTDYVHSNNTKTPIRANSLINGTMSGDIVDQLERSYYMNNNLGSIVNIHSKDIINNVGSFDLLTYSFPCQDLSSAGKFQNGNRGMKKNSGTRSGLLWEIERILDELRSESSASINYLPRYLLLENVENMLSPLHINDYLKWIKTLKEIGYNTQTFLLNAKDFGIPQSRKRVYAISVLKDKDFTDTYEKNKNKKLSLRDKILENNDLIPKVAKAFGIEKTMEDVIKDDYSIKGLKEEAAACVLNDTPSRRKMSLKNPFLLILKNRWNKDKLSRYRVNRYHLGSDGKHYYDFTKTITTKQDRNPNGGLIQIPQSLQSYAYKNYYGGFPKLDYRFLTPRETFLLMGFDDEDFNKLISSKIPLTKEVLYREAGNSIVVNVLVSIFKYMFKL